MLACKKLDVDPTKCVYLGDHERDIEAGKAAGMPTITCRWGYISDDEDIDAWKADYICHTEADTEEVLLG